MNKEVKEIIKGLEGVVKKPKTTLFDIPCPNVYILNPKGAKLLLKYITSLEQANKNTYETLQEKDKEISHLRQNKERTLEYIENNRIREKCIVDVNTLEGLLNE